MIILVIHSKDLFDDTVNPYWQPVDDPDDNSQNLLMTPMPTNDYLLKTHDDDIDDPWDDTHNLCWCLVKKRYIMCSLQWM